MKTVLVMSLVLGIGFFVGALNPSEAAEYPQKSITLVMPHPPGGSTDMIGRVLAEKLKGHLGQPVAVINKSSIQVGLSEVILAKPDGYTIGYTHSNWLTLSPLQTKLPFKGPQDMSIIATGHKMSLVIGTSPTSLWKTTKDLLEASKLAAGKIRVGGSATGSLNHVAILDLNNIGKGQLTYVPFAGGAPAVAAFLGGHVEALTTAFFEFKPHIEAGKARLIGVFAPQRVETMPDVPTMKEQGFDVGNYEFTGVLFGPKELPDKVKSTLQEAVKKVIQESSYINTMRSNGFEIPFVSAGDLGKQLATEHEQMKVFVERFNLKF